jgi:hypothetical protein
MDRVGVRFQRELVGHAGEVLGSAAVSDAHS